MHYFRIWKQLTRCAFASTLSNRIDSLSYLMGKLVRLAFFWLLIVSIFRFTDTLAGYSQYEVLLFFLTYNFIDVLTQFLFRGIYLFRNDVNRGTFDYALIRPMNPLFYSLTRLTDILDLFFLVPITALLIYIIPQLPQEISFLSYILYGLYVLLGVLTALSFHTISAAITLATAESEQVIWIYRETMAIGRFPPEVYAPSIQWFFTYIIPIIVIVAFPTKLLLGQLPPHQAGLGIVISCLFFIASIFIWHLALRRYSSASS